MGISVKPPDMNIKTDGIKLLLAIKNCWKRERFLWYGYMEWKIQIFSLRMGRAGGILFKYSKFLKYNPFKSQLL